MGQICSQKPCQSLECTEMLCAPGSQGRDKKQEKQNQIMLFLYSDLYQELQNKLQNYQNNTNISLQIVLNIFLYNNFKDESIERCFNLLKSDDAYKEDLQLIGIYRESFLKYIKNGFCSLCTLENIECFSLRCQHIFCKDCWNQMIEIQLSNFIPIVKCLENQCQERLPHQFLEQKQLYKEILIMRMLENDKYYTWCPGLNCQNLYKQQELTQKLKCKCGVKFCPYCKVENHYPIFCEIYKEITQYKEWSQSWITLDICVCPFCKRNIQKIQGCCQIQCVCGNDFCTKCLQSWNKEHGSNYFICSYASYNKNPSQRLNQMRETESNINKVIFQLENYKKQLSQQNQNFQTHILDKSLSNLIKYHKFERIAQYFTYYLNEIFNDNQLNHYCEQFSLELKNYLRIFKNQLSSVIYLDQELNINEQVNQKDFVKLTYSIEQNLNYQVYGLKKQIILIQKVKQYDAK